MARRTAKIDGLTHIECLWDEVFTGLAEPKTLKKGERVNLPFDVALLLIRAKAAKNV